MAQSILIIDDDIISQNMLRSTLAQAGYSVTVAFNGEEGIKKASERLPGLIILDIMMPEMDGGEVATLLKNDPATKDIPIIFLSSLITEKAKKSNSKKEAIVYLPKPYNRDDLLNEVKKYFLEVNQQNNLKEGDNS
jgi:CheY-like chemotaxis protein